MPRALLLALAFACGEAPTPHAPADPSKAPPPTATQAGGQQTAPTTPKPPEMSDNVDLVVACQQAVEDHPDLDRAQGASGSVLNTLGYRCYKAGLLPEAAHLFRLAVRVDGNHALAHYNLACTLSLLRRKGQVCEHDAYVSTILHHLERSVAIDPKRRTRMREDADLEEVRDSLRYRLLDGARQDDVTQLRGALKGVKMWGLPMGAYGSMWTVVFEGPGDGSQASIARMTLRSFDDDGNMTEREVKGSWSAQPGRVSVRFPGDVPGSGSFAITPTGDLIDPGKSGVDALVWLSAPDECSA